MEFEGTLCKVNAERSAPIKKAKGDTKIADAPKKCPSSWKETAMEAQMTKWDAQADAIKIQKELTIVKKQTRLQITQ